VALSVALKFKFVAVTVKPRFVHAADRLFPYARIDAMKLDYSVPSLCANLAVSPSGY
jgi:hypothetical protein